MKCLLQIHETNLSNLGNLCLSQVEGVAGIMAAYSSALHNVSLAGPTLFGQVINKAADIAGRSLANNQAKYYVLLIITVCSRVNRHLFFQAQFCCI